MKKATKTDNQKGIGSEKSYTKEFFDELYTKICIEDRYQKRILERTIILAAQAYITNHSRYQSDAPSHEVQKELKKALNHLDKVAQSLIKVYAKSDYGEDIVNNLYEIILKKYPSLHGILPEIKRSSPSGTIISPLGSMSLLESMAEAIDLTLKNDQPRKTLPRSVALYNWVMILSAKLEPIIGHKFEQSHYYKEGKKGSYISKKKISDSELLLFIITPLDPSVTIAQIETVIKETRQERHDAPWDDYFP